MSTAWKDDMAGGFPVQTGAPPPVRVEPLYFPSGDQSLFACYHAARGRATGLGMVLVSSLGHEYIQFHRVYRQLAYLLADAGVAVLRFDLTGCGDSSGDDADWSLERWRGDVRAAVQDLRQRAGLHRVGLVGLRLGGALALQVATQGEELDRLVLWDPVVDGPGHLRELDGLHAAMVRYAHVQERPPERGPTREVLGFALPDSIGGALAQLDLLTVPGANLPPTLLLETNPNQAQAPLARHLAGRPGFLHESFDNPHLWVWIEDFAKVHVPLLILRRIVGWCAEATS